MNALLLTMSLALNSANGLPVNLETKTELKIERKDKMSRLGKFMLAASASILGSALGAYLYHQLSTNCVIITTE